MNTVDIQTKYLNFISELIKLFPSKNDKLIHLHKSITNDNKQIDTILSKYVDSVNSSPKFQKLLISKNNKLFHKTDNNNITFLPSINIKKLLQSSNETTREYIWNNAFDFYSLLSPKNETVDTLLKSKANNNFGLRDIIKDLNSSLKSLTSNPDSFKDPTSLITQLTNKGMNLFNEKYKNVQTPNNLSMKEIFSEIKSVLKEDTNLNIPDIDLPDDFDPFSLLEKLLNGQNLSDLLNGVDINNFNLADFFKNLNTSTGDSKPLTDEQILELEEFYRNNDINKLMDDLKKIQ